MHAPAVFTVALLLLALLLGASGSRAGLGSGVAGLLSSQAASLSAGPMDGYGDGAVANFGNTAGEAVYQGGLGNQGFGNGGVTVEERLPSTPDVFTSPEHLRNYLNKLNAYYAIAGRPRFGKRSDRAPVPSGPQAQPSNRRMWRPQEYYPTEDY